MTSSSVLGLDVGGANLKAAHSTGAAQLRPFELWKNPAGLTAALQDLVRPLPPWDQLAVTMTGELCDCFETRRQGVEAILAAVVRVAGDRRVRVWQTTGRFVDLAQARAAPLRVAAANWLALARFAGRFAPPGPALVLDIGSTTTDLVPLLDGRPVPRGHTDAERLRCRELVYTGVRRTPVCALLAGEGAAECFATVLDAYLLLGWVPEDPADCWTADGRPATRVHAHARLARMLCADGETCPEETTRRLAEEVHTRQVRLIRAALACVAENSPAPPTTVVLAGSGEFLARKVLDQPPALRADRIALAQRLGPALSEAACAYAMAVLAAEDDEDAWGTIPGSCGR